MKLFNCKLLIVFPLFFFSNWICEAQSIILGAYYYDGWGGQKRPKLTDNFPERMPIWGWKTSTPEVIEKQIDAAADAGISFFSFCWFYKKGQNNNLTIADLPINNALNLYRTAANKNRLKYNLLVSNHEGFRITAADWNNLCEYWCVLFKDDTYLLVDGKPTITFFDIRSLYKAFGSNEKLSDALDKLRSVAKKNGLKGVSIGASVSNVNMAKQAEEGGFDFLTGYNYHGSGLWNKENLEVVSVNRMRSAETKVWNDLASSTSKPIIPIVTLNWDKRPLDKDSVTRSPRFIGYSPKSVQQSVISCKQWIQKNQKYVLNGNIAVLYAWNEYGEGAWLTPTEQQKDSLLQAVKKGMKD